MKERRTQSEIRVEALTEHAQFDQCVDVEDAVWGYELAAKMTQKVFLLASVIGGQVLGAYDDETLVGYAMSLPGVRNGHAYLHSHHLAVLAEWRNAGVGRRLKLAQRDDALARGFELIEWTFDPLEIKNAHLNIAKLGAICRRYKRDFYGPSSSPLQGGLPTDRVYAEWWLRSKRVERVLGGDVLTPRAGQVVTVPAELAEWKASAPYRDAARQVQTRIAGELSAAFADGLAVVGYTRSSDGSGHFLLDPWEENLKY